MFFILKRKSFRSVRDAEIVIVRTPCLCLRFINILWFCSFWLICDYSRCLVFSMPPLFFVQCFWFYGNVFWFTSSQSHLISISCVFPLCAISLFPCVYISVCLPLFFVGASVSHLYFFRVSVLLVFLCVFSASVSSCFRFDFLFVVFPVWSMPFQLLFCTSPIKLTPCIVCVWVHTLHLHMVSLANCHSTLRPYYGPSGLRVISAARSFLKEGVRQEARRAQEHESFDGSRLALGSVPQLPN